MAPRARGIERAWRVPSGRFIRRNSDSGYASVAELAGHCQYRGLRSRLPPNVIAHKPSSKAPGVAAPASAVLRTLSCMETPNVSIDDYERLARAKLPPEVFDYYAGGSGAEWSLSDNLAAFDRWIIRPRVLVGVAERDTSTDLLGTPVSLPVLVAPWAFQSMADPEGEVATARGAANAGTIMVLSATASHRLVDVAEATDAPKWFQLYVYRDRAFSKDVLAQAYELAFGAVVFTVDVPVLGKRDRDRRNELDMPIEGPGQELDFDPAIDWDDLAWIRDTAPIPLLIKGIQTAEDARLAAEHGVDGIVVSNHGGRQLDGSPATLDALVEVVDAVEGRIMVLMDGGVRRGTDILKALALGARAVMVGRPMVWGLAAAGAEGVANVLEILRDEFDIALALCGCRSVNEIRRSLVRRAE
jgi:isopentenyl diphosphate isomerase/L-lactate dehydrogenase-like FMN-dependent dehydrogenase